MSPNGSRTHVALNVEQLIPKVPKAMRYACRFYGYQANWDEVEDLSQDIRVKLIKDGGRVLLSFNGRSSVDTWLYKVVRRELRPYLLRRRWEKENLSNVDDLSPETLRYEANQEEGLIYEEKRKTLRAIISRLPDRKRRLVELDTQELKSQEIAKEMEIKIESVYRLKSATLKEIQRLIEGGVDSLGRAA